LARLQLLRGCGFHRGSPTHSTTRHDVDDDVFEHLNVPHIVDVINVNSWLHDDQSNAVNDIVDVSPDRSIIIVDDFANRVTYWSGPYIVGFWGVGVCVSGLPG
jgi:hypothetical protein